jgi:hypothetical protein
VMEGTPPRFGRRKQVVFMTFLRAPTRGAGASASWTFSFCRSSRASIDLLGIALSRRLLDLATQVWSDEPAFAHDKFHSARRGALGVHLMQPRDHQPLAMLNAGYADSERIHLKTEFRTAPRK